RLEKKFGRSIQRGQAFFYEEIGGRSEIKNRRRKKLLVNGLTAPPACVQSATSGDTRTHFKRRGNQPPRRFPSAASLPTRTINRCHDGAMDGRCARETGQESTMSDMDIVPAVLNLLAEKLGSKCCELWFGSTTRLTVAGNSLVVEAASQFAQNWLR